MKFLDRFVSRNALKVPFVRELMLRAADVIRESKSFSKNDEFESSMRMEAELQLASFRRRASEILELKRAELSCVDPKAGEAIAESHRIPVEGPAQFKERLWELELALEDRGWVRETTLAALEFSRYGVQQLIKICRIYAIKNPLIKRTAEICMLYVFGRGFEVRSDDDTEDETIQDFLKLNDGVLGHTAIAQLETSMQTDGALYFGCETLPDGTVKLNIIEPLEVMDTICKPTDRSTPLYFYRNWEQEDFDIKTGARSITPIKCWYPSVEAVMEPGYVMPSKDQKINGAPLNGEMPILRVKVGSPRFWRWGLPPIYACIDWARAYKDFLEDWATVQRALARFALMVETKGGPGAIAAYNAVFNTTFADNNATSIERNPPPNVASAHVSGPGNTIQPFKTANAQTSPEQARRVLLMHCAGAGMPETFFGDASTGSLATAVSLDRPTELKFTEIQRRWTATILGLLGYAVFVAKSAPGSKLREARQKNPAPQEPRRMVKFPNVIEHDMQKTIQAITEIATLGGRNGIPAGTVDRKTIVDLQLAEIGVEDREKALDDMGYGEGYNPKKDIEDQRTQLAPQLNTGAPTPGEPGKPASPKPAPVKNGTASA